MTTRAIKIDELKPIDETSVQILRVISLHLGQDPSAFVEGKRKAVHPELRSGGNGGTHMSENFTLRELREQNKKSREEVSAALGVTANAVTNYECGIRRISLEQVLLLAVLYDVSAEEVIKAQLESVRICKSD